MAEVWVARHEELKSLVAIKFLDRAGDRDERERVAERFRFEAQISARLAGRTRHVVAVHDAGVHESTPYVVMEYVPGKSLEALLDAEGTMDPGAVATLLDQLADALSAAHVLGIVHRDVKPSNVLLHQREPGEPWTAKLADFGIAKAFGADRELDRPRETEEGLLVGSPAYMSPEQIGSDTPIDGRSDLWSVGVMVYEALTGWPPFSGRKLAELVVAITTKSPDPPSQIRGTLGPGIDAWMARALARRPEDRFQTVAEMTAAFHEALEPTPDVPVVAKRTRWVPAAVVAGGILLVAGALVLGLRNRPGTNDSMGASPSGSAVIAAPKPPPVPPRDVVAIPPPPDSPLADEPPAAPPDTHSTATVADKLPASGRPRPSPGPKPTTTAPPPKEVNKSETF
jgi:serine/threonine-protein kinase